MGLGETTQELATGKPVKLRHQKPKPSSRASPKQAKSAA